MTQPNAPSVSPAWRLVVEHADGRRSYMPDYALPAAPEPEPVCGCHCHQSVYCPECGAPNGEVTA